MTESRRELVHITSSTLHCAEVNLSYVNLNNIEKIKKLKQAIEYLGVRNSVISIQLLKIGIT